MPSRIASPPAPPPVQPMRATPPWVRPLLLVLATLYLLCTFSIDAGDSDMWWHLAVGKYIWQNHHLPVPDPFSFTTSMGTPVYVGELTTRHFNLTHECGMELIYYLVLSRTDSQGWSCSPPA